MCRQSVFLVTKIFWLVFALLTFLGTSCSVYKPDSVDVSKMDYNQRLDVEDPHYDKVISVLGVGSMAAGTAAGAYAGYNFGEEADMFPYYEGDKLRHRNWASAIVGGAIGFAGTYLANRAFGWGKRKQAESSQEWLQDTNPNFKVLSDRGGDYELMHKDIEQSYRIRNFGDARDFMTVFGAQSPYFENMAGQVADNNAISRSEYGEAVSLLSESRYVPEFKKKYIKSSTSIKDLFSATSKFTDMDLNIPEIGSGLVVDFNDALLFNKELGETDYDRKTVVRSMLNGGKPREARRLKREFGSDFDISPFHLKKYNVGNTGRRNYVNALLDIENSNNVLDILHTYNSNCDFKYPNMGKDLLHDFWKAGYDQYDDGDLLVVFTRKLKDFAECTGIRKKTISSYIDDQLMKEVKENVTIDYDDYVGTANDDWEDWVDNETYTAGIVNDEGKLHFIAVGDVKNNSKFTLPVSINVEADLYRVGKMKGSNWFTKGLASFAPNVVDKIGHTSNKSIFPGVGPGRSSKYAVYLDFGRGSRRTGINIGDWVKFVSNTKLHNMNISYSYAFNKPGKAQIRKQKTWASIANNGFPDANLVDLWRGETYSDETWRKKYEAKLKREAAAAARARENSSSSSSSSSDIKILKGRKYVGANCDKNSSYEDDYTVSIDVDGEIISGTFSYYDEYGDYNSKDITSENNGMLSGESLTIYGLNKNVKVTITAEFDGSNLLIDDDETATVSVELTGGPGSYALFFTR